MIDLADVRARARTIDTLIYRSVPGFLSVSDFEDAVAALEFGNANPPALYVSLSAERAAPNRLATGGIAQRVDAVISFLFCLGAENAEGERSDILERARGAIIAKFFGYQPPGAKRGFHYAGYQLRDQSDGLIWGEVLMSAPWDLRTA